MRKFIGVSKRVMGGSPPKKQGLWVVLAEEALPVEFASQPDLLTSRMVGVTSRGGGPIAEATTAVETSTAELDAASPPRGVSAAATAETPVITSGAS